MVSYIEKWENWVALGKDVKNISGFNKTFSYDCTLYFCTTFVSQDIGIFLFHLFFSLTKRCKKSFPWHCMNHLYTFWWQGGARCKNPCKDILLLIFLVSCKDVFFYPPTLSRTYPSDKNHVSPSPRGSETHLRGGTSEVWNYRNTVAFIANYRCTGDDCHEITDFYLHDVSEISKPSKIYWNYRTIAPKFPNTVISYPLSEPVEVGTVGVWLHPCWF